MKSPEASKSKENQIHPDEVIACKGRGGDLGKWVWNEYHLQ